MSGNIGIIKPYVAIDNVQWQRRNLNVTTYRNGDVIPYMKREDWINITTGAWCWYNNSSTNGDIYGKLYNGYAIADPRGIAPVGWRLPTDTDWDDLVNFLGGFSVAGTALKRNNIYSFKALFAGYRDDQGTGTFIDLGLGGYWWGSSYVYSVDATTIVTRYEIGVDVTNNYGFSVRCIKD